MDLPVLVNRLRDLREAHGLSQPQLAEKSNVSERLIVLLETEPGYRPRFESAEALCRYFDVPLGRLFFFDWESAPGRARESLAEMAS
jgi:transcriptional regulator with XRE-family HTH domain